MVKVLEVIEVERRLMQTGVTLVGLVVMGGSFPNKG